MTHIQKHILLIASLVVLIIGFTGFGLLGWAAQGEKIAETEMPLGASAEAPIVHFASYKMAEGIPLTMTADSVEKDLSISILDEDSLPVTNVVFEVIATPPEGDPILLKDEAAVGKIYADDLEPGEYTLALQKTGRFIVPEPITVEVKKEVERKVIANIGDKLVNSKNVNTATEDAKNGNGGGETTPAPPASTDTIPFYETKTVEKPTEVTVQVTVYAPLLDGEGFLVPKDAGVQALQVSMMAVEGEQPATMRYRPDLNSDGSIIAAVSETGERITDIELIKSMFHYEEKVITRTEQKIELILQGWQTIEGKKYYYNLEGVPVTGSQIIQGVSYQFDESGVLQENVANNNNNNAAVSGTVKGIDISTWNNAINWTAAKNSGIHFAMIRAGYRGYTQGTLIEDDKFKMHAQGAQAAGVKVGLYYFSQAINEREAVEEASAAIAIAQKYGINVNYPIAIDIEYVSSSRPGRADHLPGSMRTAIAKAFCDTIQNAGYTPMIYSSKSWFESPSYLDINQLSHYRIWVAHWTTASQTSYNRSRLDMWQYTSDGVVPGVPGRVDVNYSYMGY